VTKISRVKCSTGEDWLSWPVGTLSPAISRAESKFAGDLETVSRVIETLHSSDQRLGALGAAVAGLWIPDGQTGSILGEFWAGLQHEPEADLHSTLRYKRSITQRRSADVTVFSQSIADFVVHDTEAVTLVENCAEDNGRPLVRVTVVYFPAGIVRPILRAICFIPTLAKPFTTAIGQIAGTVTWAADETEDTTEMPDA